MSLSVEEASASELLEAFIGKYNAIVAENNELLDTNAYLQAQVTENAEAAGKLAEAHGALEQLITKHQALEKTAELMAKDLARTKTALGLAQQAVQVLNQKNPDRLAEQVKRLKASNEDLTTRNNKLAGDNKNLTTWNKNRDAQIKEQSATIENLEKRLAYNQGSGIFHSGPHHLIVWPESVRMQNADGSEYTSQALLYMHQSGRGALLTHSPELGMQMAASPAGGLKLNGDYEQFAKNWLFKVNVLQNGIVTEQDMMKFDHNTGVES
jgi:cell division septum initiation protein DivIVA